MSRKLLILATSVAVFTLIFSATEAQARHCRSHRSNSCYQNSNYGCQQAVHNGCQQTANCGFQQQTANAGCQQTNCIATNACCNPQPACCGVQPTSATSAVIDSNATPQPPVELAPIPAT